MRTFLNHFCYFTVKRHYDPGNYEPHIQKINTKSFIFDVAQNLINSQKSLLGSCVFLFFFHILEMLVVVIAFNFYFPPKKGFCLSLKCLLM